MENIDIPSHASIMNSCSGRISFIITSGKARKEKIINLAKGLRLKNKHRS